MRDRAPVALILIAVVAIVVSGCPSTPDRPPGGGGDSVYPRTKAGESFLDGALVVDSVTKPKQGGTQVRFVVKNVSGEDFEDLSATIILYSPPKGGIQQFDSEPVNLSFSIFGGEAKTLVATPRDASTVKGWVLRIAIARTVKREGGAPGSRYLDGTLECVDIQGDPTEFKPRIEYTLENIGREPVQLIEYRVVFRKASKTVAATEWILDERPIGLGQRIVLKPDISHLEVGSAEALLEIKKGIW